MPDIVDTNVIAVANFRNENASLECEEASIDYLSKYLQRTYAVDSGNKIFDHTADLNTSLFIFTIFYSYPFGK